ncbi:hypothetical protein ACPW96_04815 [Micromonospora sp. DT81.3]|uniref:hypothetical protein n=1 Tax=Micromonospora sp. DT81.3 TaxID=3416523 RepID=UPI003CF36E15
MTRRIARAAPADVRRLLNISGREGVKRLADLALVHGFSTFIVGSDDGAFLRSFAEETAPRVREIVEDGRRAGPRG